MLGIVTGLELEKQLCLKAYKAIAKDRPLIICAAGTVEGAKRAAKDLIDHGASHLVSCLLYTSPSPRDQRGSRMPSSA